MNGLNASFYVCVARFFQSMARLCDEAGFMRRLENVYRDVAGCGETLCALRSC